MNARQRPPLSQRVLPTQSNATTNAIRPQLIRVTLPGSLPWDLMSVWVSEQPNSFLSRVHVDTG